MKTPLERLKAFIKANKVRRERIAQINGFTSGAEYKAHLEQLIAGEPDDKIVVHNVHILDRSGSMGRRSSAHSKLTNALIGINDEISELKQDNSVDYLQSFVLFDDRIIVDSFRQPVKDMNPVNASHGGMTALYQAIGETLEMIIANKDDDEKTIVKVFTDGNENASRGKFSNSAELSAFIKTAEDHDVTVSFVGTVADTERVIRMLGIDESNTLVHNNTAEDVKRVFKTTASATKTYVARSLAGEDTLTGFYKQEGTL